jgi:hypothetical protein
VRPDPRLLPAALAVLLVLVAGAAGLVLVSRPSSDEAGNVAPVTLAPDEARPPGPRRPPTVHRCGSRWQATG